LQVSFRVYVAGPAGHSILREIGGGLIPMDERLFISYSRADGGDFAYRLADELEAGPPRYPVWVDRRRVHPGREDWDDQLAEAIQTCRALLFVMTRDSVRVGSVCKDEWAWALKHKRPVIPVRADAEADLPLRLSSRQFVDFSASFADGLADLRRHLRWMSTPEGELKELQTRLAEAERELPRVDVGQQSRIEQEIKDLRQRIEAQIDRAGVRIRAGMQRERKPAPVVAARAQFLNPPPMVAPPYFQDRYVETGLIGAFLRNDGWRMITVTGRSGIGKTAMVCRLLRALERGRLPDDLGELAVDGIVYLNPAGMHPITFPNLFSDLCRLLPANRARPLLGRYRDPQATPAALMRALLEAFPPGRTVVVLLDSFEGLVDRETFALTDPALDEALRTVLTAPVHGVKVIITTQVAPRGLLLTQPGVQPPPLGLDMGLPSPYAENVLRERDPDGSLGVKNAPDELLAQAREWTRGFPRALEALMAILAVDRSTTLPGRLAEPMPENVIEVLAGEMFSRLDLLAQQVMQALAIYAVPVPPVAVDYLLRFFQPVIDSAPVLNRLVNMYVVRGDAGRYYLHPVDRGYALSRVAPGEPGDYDTEPLPFTQYALRGRAADYFRRIRSPRETWRNLTDLDPLEAEFELRCQIGDYDAAAQVLLDVDLDYLIRWGNYRLTIDLHNKLQGHLTDPRTDSASKCNLGICYAALGQTQRAIEFHQLSLARTQEIGARLTKANQLRHLGDCHADLGKWQQAGGYCAQAIQISDEIGFAQGRSEGRLSLATVQLHAGELDAALQTAQAASADDYPPAAADLSLILGIVLARQAKRDAASRAFTDAVRSASTLIEQTSQNFHALDTKALALCGQALIEGTSQLTEASTIFRAARTITRARGIVQRVLRLFDALAAADTAGILEPIRMAASNDA
jgi:tetratricopeptide (TPR) repeat protein